jgi:hypothetical protein
LCRTCVQKQNKLIDSNEFGCGKAKKACKIVLASGSEIH